MGITVSKLQTKLPLQEAIQPGIVSPLARVGFPQTILAGYAKQLNGVTQRIASSLVAEATADLRKTLNDMSQSPLKQVTQSVAEISAQHFKTARELFQTDYTSMPPGVSLALPQRRQQHHTLVINIITDPALFSDDGEE